MDRKPVKIILDTDIGGDCDDAGALGLLNALADLDEAQIMGVTSCTSLKNAPGAIDAINRYYGRTNIPVGAYNGEPFYENPAAEHYISYLNGHYETIYKNKEDAQDAVQLLRKLLSAEKENGIKIVAIGPLRVMRMLLDSGPDGISPLTGRQIIMEKVSELVVMGGYFPETDKEIFLGDMKLEAEFNIAGDVKSAQKVMNHWPTPIVLCPYEIGYEIMTGMPMIEKNPDSPVSMAYKMYCGGSRESWDLTTVLYAVRGPGSNWTVSDPGTIFIDDRGVSTWCGDKVKKHYYLKKNRDPDFVKNEIDELLMKDPIKNETKYK